MRFQPHFTLHCILIHYIYFMIHQHLAEVLHYTLTVRAHGYVDGMASTRTRTSDGAPAVEWGHVPCWVYPITRAQWNMMVSKGLVQK